MYCEYWNIKKPPFDNVPDALMYVDSHTSMQNAISEILFAVKEAHESFAVIIGAAGLGKTLSLRVIIDALDPRQYKIALMTNPSLSFSQLLKEIIGQVSGTPCTENRKVNLLEMFNHLLLQTASQEARVVIFIDEASSLSSANLENLRLLTNMQDGQHNLFSVVLAGQLDLAERLEHPKRVNLFQRIGTYVRIDKLPSEEAVNSYIETRLKLAGTQIKIFSDECIPVIWEYSEHGVPRLVNRICKLCLSIGESNKLDYIKADVVLQTAERFQKLSKSAVQKRKPRTRPGISLVSEFSPVTLDEKMTTVELSDKSENNSSSLTEISGPMIPFPVSSSEPDIGREVEEPFMTATEQTAQPQTVTVTSEEECANPESPDKSQAAAQACEPDISLTIQVNGQTSEYFDAQEPPVMKDDQVILPEPADEPWDQQKEVVGISSENQGGPAAPGKTPLAQSVPTEEAEEAPALSPSEDIQDAITVHDSQTLEDIPPEPVNDASMTAGEADGSPSDHSEAEGQKTTDIEHSDEIDIGEYRIKLNIPSEVLRQVKSFNKTNVNKSAGFWAAQIIKNNPQLTSSPHADPVMIWNEIRDNILKKIAV